MAVLQSKQITQNSAIPTGSSATQPVVIVGDYDVPAGGLALNTVIEMCGIPPHHFVLSCALDAPDLDTNGSPTIGLDVGLIAGTYGDATRAATIGAEFLAASTIARTGGRAVSALNHAAVLPSAAERAVGVKIQAAAATAAAGTLRLILQVAPVQGPMTYA